jgi:Ca2+/H+ antiporter, TMEM165/GDT1 family
MLAVGAHSSDAVLVAAVFLACAVEMVEALTIVLAVGTTRGWRSALEGTGVALLCLAGLVAVFGPAMAHVPLDWLRLVVGAVLLVFGAQWLRKSILRATGLKARHDEDEIFAEAVAELDELGARPDRDRLAFVMAFKGVFLEGVEVVVTVLTLGTSAHRLGLAAATAVAGLVLVGAVGLIVGRQLSEVPENALKMAVGIMLLSYGTFWSGEGIGIRWPGSDAMLLGFVALYAVLTAALVGAVRRAAVEEVAS